MIKEENPGVFVRGKIRGNYYVGKPSLVGNRYGGARINQNNIITILIHGTFTASFVFGDHWPNFSKIRAKIIGHTFGGGQVYSFLWSGKNNQARRKEAAFILAKYIEYFYKKDNSIKINLVAHSHGGNVAKLALNYVSEMIPRRPIVENLVNIATPVRNDVRLESKDYFGYFIQISSPSDMVVPLAGLDFKGKPVFKTRHKDLDYVDLNLRIKGLSHGQLVGISVFQYLQENYSRLKKEYPHTRFSGSKTIFKIILP